jgi:hypothetical protein
MNECTQASVCNLSSRPICACCAGIALFFLPIGTVSLVERHRYLLHPGRQGGRKCLLYVGDLRGSVFPFKCDVLR